MCCLTGITAAQNLPKKQLLRTVLFIAPIVLLAKLVPVMSLFTKLSFSVIQPKVVKTDTCSIELPESVKVQFSTSNLDNVKLVWDEVKKQIDNAITSSPEAFSGLPLVDVA